MMTEEVMDLVAAMDGGDWEEELVRHMCRTACQQLERRLKPGVRPEDCGGAFPIAAAWLALSGLQAGCGADGVTSFSAGDLSIRTGDSRSSRMLEARAEALMAPYCREERFAAMGVKG